MPVTHRYKPANTAADLPPGSRFQAMDAFLLSDRVADVALAAARDIADDARDLAARTASETGRYASSFHAVESPVPLGGGLSAHGEAPTTLEGGPRRAAEVYNDDPAAASNEFGASEQLRPGRRILRRAAEKYDVPKVSTWP